MCSDSIIVLACLLTCLPASTPRSFQLLGVADLDRTVRRWCPSPRMTEIRRLLRQQRRMERRTAGPIGTHHNGSGCSPAHGTHPVSSVASLHYSSAGSTTEHTQTYTFCTAYTVKITWFIFHVILRTARYCYSKSSVFL